MSPSFFTKTFEVAASVKDPVAAAVCGLVIACVAFSLALRKKDKAVVLSLGLVLCAGIVFLGALPLLAKSYLSTHDVYEIRVVALGPDGSPIEGASVICSPGGEEKKIPGGWECDVPPRNRPVDRLFTAYISESSAFLTGKGQIHLANDHNPVLTVQLQRDASATVQGQVEGPRGNVLSGAWVSVVGHEPDAVQSGRGGGFILRSHAASGQMIKLHVEMSGYQPYDGLQLAGDTSISIKLLR